jgi:hypothetical protein
VLAITKIAQPDLQVFGVVLLDFCTVSHD